MKKLLKRQFELWVKMRWLKTIDKEIKKRRKYLFKYKRQEYVVNKLVDEYNKIYADSVIKIKDVSKKNEEIEICLNCKKKKCRGYCNKFKEEKNNAN